MLTSEEIKIFKTIFGPISAVTIDGTKYIYRSLTRKEAIEIGIFSNADISPEAEDQILTLAVLDPKIENADDLDISTVTTLTNAILWHSGLSSLENIQEQLDKARERRTVYSQLTDVILAATDLYTPDELNEMIIPDLMDLFVTCEQVLILRGLLAEEIVIAEETQEPVSEQELLERKLHGALEKAQQEGVL